MKYFTYVLLLGSALAAQDPYMCIPEEPCNDKMECIRRQVLEVRETQTYTNASNNDPTLKLGEPAYWCIPDEWVKSTMDSSGQWDNSSDTRSEFELIEKPEALSDDGSKAYVAGIECDPENGRCPYNDLRCVGRRIVKVDTESSQYQKMVSVDPTFNQGETSFWCVTDEIFKIGLEWNNKMNQAWGVEMKMWEIESTPIQANE